MAYDTHLEDRISAVLKEKKIVFEAKKMMGGLCYMVDDKMCVGIIKNDLMCRVGAENYDEALQEDYAEEMKFTGRPLKGFILVEQEGIDLDDQLEYWIQKCLDYNPLAKSSKKKRK